MEQRVSNGPALIEVGRASETMVGLRSALMRAAFDPSFAVPRNTTTLLLLPLTTQIDLSSLLQYDFLQIHSELHRNTY